MISAFASYCIRFIILNITKSLKKSIKDEKVSLNGSYFTFGRTNLLRNVLEAAAVTCPSPAAIPFKNCIFLAHIHFFFLPLENSIDVFAF